VIIHVDVTGEGWNYSLTDDNEQRIGEWLLHTVRREAKKSRKLGYNNPVMVRVTERSGTE